MEDKVRNIKKWLNFGLNAANTIIYPIKKTYRYTALVAEIESEDFETQQLLDDVDNYGDDVISNELDYSDMEMSPSKFKQNVEAIAGILDAINKVVNALNAFDIILSLPDKEKKILCITLNKKTLNIIKWVCIGTAVLGGILFALDKYIASKSGKTSMLNKFLKRFGNYIYAVVNVITAFYGAMMLYLIIRHMIKSKSMSINSANRLVSALLLTSSIVEIYWIEKALAKSKYGYMGVYGGVTLLKAAKTVLIPMTTKEEVCIYKTNFDAIQETDSSALFVYFCGTHESTNKHLDQYMTDVNAMHQIYINGIGAEQTVYDCHYPEHASVSKSQVGNYTQVYHITHTKRNIYCIEKVYKGGGQGYTEDDSRKVGQYTMNTVCKMLDEQTGITKIVFAGHSRGAAVGLTSFLYYMLSDKSVERIQKMKIGILFLDPVAGQTSNNYHMDKNWTTADLHKKLEEKFSSAVSAYEVWANSASFAMGANFNPARRFISNPAHDAYPLRRFILGFAHSDMVLKANDRAEYYSSNKSPYHLLVKLINEYIIQLPNMDRQTFENLFKAYDAIFKQADQAIKDQSRFEFDKGKRTECKDLGGKKIPFKDFILSYPK